jgi:hypothetical protein
MVHWRNVSSIMAGWIFDTALEERCDGADSRQAQVKVVSTTALGHSFLFRRLNQ